MTPYLIPKGQPIPEGVRIVGRDERGTYVLPAKPLKGTPKALRRE